MRTCPECGRVMTRITSEGNVSFMCYCGLSFAGEPEDARVAGEVLNARETEEMYRRLIVNGAFDRTNQQILKDCPQCGLDYLTQIRIGSREVVVLICKCGYNSSSG